MQTKFIVEDVLNFKWQYLGPNPINEDKPDITNDEKSNKESSLKDDVDFLNNVEPLKVIPLDKKDDKKDDKEKDSEKEEELDEKEENEEKEEVKEEEELPEFLATRPTFSEIGKKYPDFFKDFPEMKHVLGREMEYSKILPTIGDAKEAKENSDAYQFLESTFATGNARELLSTMKEADTTAYGNFVNDFLPTLSQSDSETYFKIVSPVMHGLLHEVYLTAGNKDENLKNAVLVISEHLFRDADIVTKPPAKSARIETNTNGDKVESESQKFRKERFLSAQNEIGTESLTSLQEFIFEDIKKQFPDNKIPDNIEETIVDLVDVGIKKINDEISSDQSYRAIQDSLWKQAFKSGFTGDWKERILSAYLSRAKKLIPVVSRKIAPFIPKERKVNEKRIPSNSSGSRSSSSNVPSSKDINWNKTSDRDFLEGKIATKS